jgi:hypothetical protein
VFLRWPGQEREEVFLQKFFLLLLCPPNDRTEQKAKSRVIREQKQLARTEEKEESRKKERKTSFANCSNGDFRDLAVEALETKHYKVKLKSHFAGR